ncbi:MAG: glycine reductase [Tissierellia bacterium]|nr:glycine reductase [Tissierellia bacterium]
MGYAVLKGASYILAHTPDMVLYNGTTQTTERTLNPDSDYLKEVPKNLRSYDEVVNYLPNQVYIGNKHPDDLKKLEQPWYDKPIEGTREGKFGEIMPQDEFIAMIQMCDVFDLVSLTKDFVEKVRPDIEAHPLLTDILKANFKDGVELSDIEKNIENGAEALYSGDCIVGCVKQAHQVDVNLSAHVILENLVSKASAVLSAVYAIKSAGINPEDIEYVLECSEEACGDMNQRGGGNFAKSIAEKAGLINASGSDMRGFCAAPAHTMIAAASMVRSGTFKNVLVVAGGSTAKLGMNGKDHLKKGLPILEDCVAGFAAVVGKNDGVNPVIRNDITGRHTVGTGSAPQAVTSSLVSDPLERIGLKITDIDKYSTEMQNPDITKPAGAGDVPTANFKMMAALGVQKKQIEKAALNDFIQNHGMEGWAPTQGHIPSGVPYLGFCREDILSGKIKNSMIIGKGSLFLGRMTNLFDGISFVIEKNTGVVEDSQSQGVSEDEVRKLVGETMKEFAKALLEG